MNELKELYIAQESFYNQKTYRQFIGRYNTYTQKLAEKKRNLMKMNRKGNFTIEALKFDGTFTNFV